MEKYTTIHSIKLLTGYYRKSDADWKDSFVNNVKRDIERSKGKKSRPIDHYEGFIINLILKNIGKSVDKL